MARGSSTRGQRDLSTTSTYRSLERSLLTPLTYTLPSPLLLSPSPQEVLSYGPDRRVFHPDAGSRPPAAVRSQDARVVSGPSLTALNFSRPERVALCVRRKVRKEVLHALKKTRKGAGAKRRRRNFWSEISC